jgi:lipopolysaccharide/colanic/teichoic acid biosynthesis glycosyltransferase
MPAELYRRWGKRALDVTAAGAGLLVLSPVLAGVAALIKLTDPGPVFFRQTRAGLGFRPFQIIKFRSMRWGAAGPSVTAGTDPRITRVGRVLRKTKLDELPQLLNVLRGEMSLVGPRPEVPKYVELFRGEYEKVLSVKPGITDYAAIAYRDEEAVLGRFADPEEGYVRAVLPAKLALYRRYIAEVGLRTDLKILAATGMKLLRRRNEGVGARRV